MSGMSRNVPARLAVHLSATVLGAALALSVVSCRDASRSVAPRTGLRPYLPSNSPAPAEGVVIPAPLFGLDAAPDGSLLAATGAGVFGIRAATAESIAQLPGVNGVASLGVGDAFIVTGGSTDPSQIFPTSRKLFRMSNGSVRLLADLWAYEQAVNPDRSWNQGPVPIESNPFDVAVLHGGRVLVADAAANAILVVDANGTIDWVAVLTPVDRPPGQVDPQPVPTSIAIGPDGAYYVGELTGFPAIPGLSRIWRIAPGSRQVTCPSSACTLVAGGFTSIIDLAFGPDGTLYVVELDEASWLGMEANGFMKTAAGGTVNACSVAGSCSVLASNLSLPTAVAVDKTGVLWVAEHESILFAGARVHRLP